jgi:hypothetical protein
LINPFTARRILRRWRPGRGRTAPASSEAISAAGTEAAVDPLASSAAGAGGMAGLAGVLSALAAQQGDGVTVDVSPTIDLRSEPELRGKLERVLGRKLQPGAGETIDVAGDPELAARIMHVVAEHATGRGAATPSTAPAGEEKIAQLERLARLRSAGALSDAEFEAQKRRLLGGP